jgi:hypothetical protein
MWRRRAVAPLELEMPRYDPSQQELIDEIPIEPEDEQRP